MLIDILCIYNTNDATFSINNINCVEREKIKEQNSLCD